MAPILEEEKILKFLRNRLNQEKVKLWEPPYTTSENQTNGNYPIEMLENFSKDLNVSIEKIQSVFEKLRVNALEKLKSRKEFQETGIATFKIKYIGDMIEGHNDEFTIKLSLSCSGITLKEKIESKIGLCLSQMKVICCGRMIEDESTLLSQNVKNLSLMMAVPINESVKKHLKEEENISNFAKTRAAAELLSSKNDGGVNDDSNYYFQIADQKGKVIELPPEERKALAFAMALNEKGRAAMKCKNYSESLLLFLEADKEFRSCNSSLLEAVDNYAILCLDITWCYLCLKNFNQLPDADDRLRTCEKCFKRSYGENLERLTVVRGGTGMEKALFIRLHLLQAIVSFHQGDIAQARSLLMTVEQEINSLKVDDDSMMQIMSMGFTQQEARLSLRVCDGDVSAAVSHITNKREEKQLLKNKEKEEKEMKAKRSKLGKTKSGNWISIDLHESLTSMGFDITKSAEALRQGDNNIDMAIEILRADSTFADKPISEETLMQVVSLGFDIESSKIALKYFKGNVEQAVEELIEANGVIQDEWLSNNSDDSLSTSTNNDKSHGGEGSTEKTVEEKKKEKEAIEHIIPDIAKTEDEHLDVTFEEEIQFLEEYKSLML